MIRSDAEAIDRTSSFRSIVTRRLSLSSPMAWQLSVQQRGDIVVRVSLSICSLALSRGEQVEDDDAAKVARSIEIRAYTAAQASAGM